VVIVKPSEVAPLTGKTVVDALSSSVPPGVVQLAQGDGAVGAQLVASADVDMVAMTGSSAVGKRLVAACANDLKRLVLELGGKDPMVVFADADLDKAAHDAVFFSLFNCGQVCCSVERVYVDAAIKEEFEEKVKAEASKYVLDNGLADGAMVGPMVSAMQLKMVADQVDAALAAGAKLLYRGPSYPASSKNASVWKGNFYPVTVLTDLTQDMTIQSSETFGPVVALAQFDGSEAEAVRLANDTEYGLASYVYTTDMAKAQRVAKSIRSGQVGINCYSLFHADINCPWVGHKGSGFGYHSGADGWRQFSVPKSLVFDSPVPERIQILGKL
jgi:succinate-semialdehyde dehydrogenase/glutarate-semialdehyde dehydrogenase